MVQVGAWASQEANRDALFQEWAKSGYPAENFRDDFAGQLLRVRNNPLLDPPCTSMAQATMARCSGRRTLSTCRAGSSRAISTRRLATSSSNVSGRRRDPDGKAIGA